MEMKLTILILLLALALNAENKESINQVDSNGLMVDSVPSLLAGKFIDDYDISYIITDSVWIQHPKSRYHILRWNYAGQYIIAKNDSANTSGAGLFTRIDYTFLTDMEPFQWGFCLSVYDAKSESLAEGGYRADKKNPRTGCNGFPFSRMKRTK